jgi:hypothetical protein
MEVEGRDALFMAAILARPVMEKVVLVEAMVYIGQLHYGDRIYQLDRRRHVK